jgi:hypothetical protein
LLARRLVLLHTVGVKLTICLLVLGLNLAAAATQPCRIEVVEQGSGWPVPLVELRTTHQARLVSDNAGNIAFDLPELLGREVWFEVHGHGYEVPADGFGMRGVRLKPEPGKVLRVEVTRTNLARRIGRLTGAGLFAESQKLGLENDWRESGIVGQDSVQNAVHRGRLFWFWGDTTVARYPLGIFHGTGATTPLTPWGDLRPPLRLRLDYFTNESGLPRSIAPMPGSGPTWVTGLASLSDKSGTPRLVCAYMKIKPPLEAYEWSLAVWNEQKDVLDKLKTIWTKSDTAHKAPPIPEGHPVLWKDTAGREWLLFGNPLPALRCPATFEAWQDERRWEKLTPQASLRGPNGETVKPHSGSIAWHPWRQRWVTVFMQSFGKPSAFGELWYAEAAEPTGPWSTAVKVLSHDNYTFYNPRLHPEFTPEGSPVLFFEGTYTMQFANKPAPTPRYDYNQILYRLDLDDPALKPAQEH